MNRSHEYVQQLVDSAKSEATVGIDFAKAQVTCHASDCGRTFRGIPSLIEHAESVHTFDDIRRMVSDKLRETYGRSGDYKANPVVPAIWVWIDDMANDWVAFMVEESSDSTLFKASYAITDTEVTLGDPVEVVRRTVYDPVKKSE